MLSLKKLLIVIFATSLCIPTAAFNIEEKVQKIFDLIEPITDGLETTLVEVGYTHSHAITDLQKAMLGLTSIVRRGIPKNVGALKQLVDYLNNIIKDLRDIINYLGALKSFPPIAILSTVVGTLSKALGGLTMAINLTDKVTG